MSYSQNNYDGGNSKKLAAIIVSIILITVVVLLWQNGTIKKMVAPVTKTTSVNSTVSPA